jgi:hypothetical protein
MQSGAKKTTPVKYECKVLKDASERRDTGERKQQPENSSVKHHTVMPVFGQLKRTFHFRDKHTHLYLCAGNMYFPM